MCKSRVDWKCKREYDDEGQKRKYKVFNFSYNYILYSTVSKDKEVGKGFETFQTKKFDDYRLPCTDYGYCGIRVCVCTRTLHIVSN